MQIGFASLFRPLLLGLLARNECSANYNRGMLSRRGALGILAVPILRGKDKRPNMFGDAEAYDRFRRFQKSRQVDNPPMLEHVQAAW